VIANLISNAVKYTNEGSVTVKLVQPDQSIVRLEVVDTGPGISGEEQKKLFQKFYRVETNVGKTTGTGLGLYISKLLVGKFGGQIGLISDIGKGSTFWFELPVVSSGEVDIANKK
jgi:two-component system sensor histidine kinase BarA